MAEVKKESDIGQRTKAFALDVLKIFRILPQTTEAQIIGKQMLRSGMSVGAQYREAKRARTRAEFSSKLESALQELEETGYWLELLLEARIATKEQLHQTVQQHHELTAIFVAAINTTKSNN